MAGKAEQFSAVEAALNDRDIAAYEDFTDAVRQVVALARKAEALERENVELREAAEFVKPAMDSLKGYERDLGDTLLDEYELGRIEDSRHSPSFRIRVGHIRRLARALLGGSENAGN